MKESKVAIEIGCQCGDCPIKILGATCGASGYPCYSVKAYEFCKASQTAYSIALKNIAALLGGAVIEFSVPEMDEDL